MRFVRIFSNKYYERDPIESYCSVFPAMVLRQKDWVWKSFELRKIQPNWRRQGSEKNLLEHRKNWKNKKYDEKKTNGQIKSNLTQFHRRGICAAAEWCVPMWISVTTNLNLVVPNPHYSNVILPFLHVVLNVWAVFFLILFLVCQEADGSLKNRCFFSDHFDVGK